MALWLESHVHTGVFRFAFAVAALVPSNVGVDREPGPDHSCTVKLGEKTPWRVACQVLVNAFGYLIVSRAFAVLVLLQSVLKGPLQLVTPPFASVSNRAELERCLDSCRFGLGGGLSGASSCVVGLDLLCRSASRLGGSVLEGTLSRSSRFRGDLSGRQVRQEGVVVLGSILRLVLVSRCCRIRMRRA